VRAALFRLKAHEKQRKFRHNQDALEETFLRSSQHSLFCSSQGTIPESNSFDSPDFLDEIPQSTQNEYKKRPLNDPSLSKQTLRRRIKDCRENITKWCTDQGCTTVQFAGLLIYFESYPIDRHAAKLGWDLFQEIKQVSPQKATVLEAIWIMERLEIS
jgi:hypothetical protein